VASSSEAKLNPSARSSVRASADLCDLPRNASIFSAQPFADLYAFAVRRFCSRFYSEIGSQTERARNRMRLAEHGRSGRHQVHRRLKKSGMPLRATISQPNQQFSTIGGKI